MSPSFLELGENVVSPHLVRMAEVRREDGDHGRGAGRGAESTLPCT